MTNKKNIMSLATIALTLGITKSKLQYYKIMGILKPIEQLGSVKNTVNFYNFSDVKKVLTLIDKHQKKGLTIKQMIEQKIV